MVLAIALASPAGIRKGSFEKGCGCVSSAAPQILYFTSGRLYPTGSKAKRASLLQNPPTRGVATLKLTDVQPSDTGTYLCHVNNPPDFYTNGLGIINLTVLGKADWGPISHPHTLTDCTGSAKGAQTLISSHAHNCTGDPKGKYLLPKVFKSRQAYSCSTLHRVLLPQSLVAKVPQIGSESCP